MPTSGLASRIINSGIIMALSLSDAADMPKLRKKFCAGVMHPTDYLPPGSQRLFPPEIGDIGKPVSCRMFNGGPLGDDEPHSALRTPPIIGGDIGPWDVVWGFAPGHGGHDKPVTQRELINRQWGKEWCKLIHFLLSLHPNFNMNPSPESINFLDAQCTLSAVQERAL
jgi:hypothetical protein